MSNGLWSLITGGLTSVLTGAAARNLKNNLLSRTVRTGAGSYAYQVYVPARLQGKTNAPVIVFLHGIGQRGTGGYLPTEGRAASLMGHYLEQVPAIVLLPQCVGGSYWSNPGMDQMVMQALHDVTTEFGADSKRLYLTGVSMGGYGVWHLASQHPGAFAALVSICGGSPLRTGDRFAPIAERIGKTPAWVFHGSADAVVPVSESRSMVEAIRAAHGNVIYSEYEGVGHNVWLKVMAERELMSWLLAQELR